MLIKEIFDRYLTEKPPEFLTAKNGNACRIAMLRTYFDHRDSADLRDAKVLYDYLEERRTGQRMSVGARGRKPGESALRREINILVSAMSRAHFHRLIPADDLPRFDKPPEAAAREHWLTKAHALRVLAAAQPDPDAPLTRAYLVCMLILHTGARKAAAEGLTWDRIHLMKTAKSFGYIDLREPGKTVSKKRRAIAPISAELYPVLVRAQLEAQSAFFLFHPGDCRYNVAKAFRDAGVKGYLTKEGHCHLMRKSCATWAAQDDVPMGQIAQMLGDTIATTEKHYAMHSPSFMQAISNRTVLGNTLQ